MLGCKFSLAKFLLLIHHPRKPRKLHTVKISAYTVVSLITTFSAQSCMSVGKSGHKRVKYIAWYLSISTNTMVTFKRYLSTSTSTQEHVRT